MNTGKLVFAQVMSHLPLTTFRRCVTRYDGEHKVKSFTFTRCTSNNDLTKLFELKDGTIIKHSAAQISAGHVDS